MNLTEEQIERYSRHILLKDVGGDGQERLLKGKVLIIGVGGLGSPAALYLAAAGVGTIGLADGDEVDVTNLQRQVIHFTPDVGKSKVESARETINILNPDVRVVSYKERVNAANILEMIKAYDFIIDGTDNFGAKFLINDACVLAGKPFSHGGILRFDGQTLTCTKGNACYRCLFIQPPPPNAVPSCSQAGVLGAVAGMLGTIQAAEALKYIIGTGELLTNRLLIFNAFNMNFRTTEFRKNPECPVCGEKAFITGLRDYEEPVCDLRSRRND
jgi:adenylyltransferase/sulfurtransferase